jgi:hypothetical protein
MKTAFHLPAVIATNYAGCLRLVSACGRRGPIRAREGVVPPQEDLLVVVAAVFRVCPECGVKWDNEEQAGRLVEVITPSGAREWAGPGTVVHEEEPTWRGKVYRSQHSYTRNGTPKDRRLRVLYRDSVTLTS